MNPNIAILSAAIAIIGLVLSIFGASWLNQRNTDRLIERLEKQLDAKFDAIDARFDQVLTEIKRVDQRIDALDKRVEKVERQLEAVFKPMVR
jgi:peptidoglycan hydrolase CwlO-like protein